MNCKIEKYNVSQNDMSRDLRLKDVFDLVSYKNNETISITKKKSIEVYYNDCDTENRDTYNLKIKDDLKSIIDLRYMYYLLKTLLCDREVVLDIHNRNIFNKSVIRYEYIKKDDLENIYIGNYNSDLGYIINERL